MSSVEEEVDGGSRSLGDYELLEPIARGGMGIVYRARQRSLNRVVALKLILSGDLAAPDALERFRLEVESVAALEHPNIVAIHEVGEEGGRHYFSMPLVEGGNLADRLSRAGRLQPREGVRLVAQLARAVHHAHQRGVLHRDIKPNNILLGPEDLPLLTDFGLAKMIERETRITRTLALIGTPAYLAPEQAAGRGDAVTTAVDIHALGAVLYEVLTGVPAFAADTTAATLRRVMDEDPVPPWVLAPDIGRDLGSVVLKCLEKDPRHRYGSAGALAEELERWLAGEPLEARPAGWSQRLLRWTRRNPWPAGTVASVLVALLITSVVSEVARRRVAEALVTTRTQKAEIERQRESTQAELVRSLSRQAEGRWEARDVSQAVAFWARALRLSPTNEAVAMRLWHGLQRSRFPTLATEPVRVTGWPLACSVNGGQPIVSVQAEGRTGRIYRWGPDAAGITSQRDLPLPTRFVAPAPDGSTLFLGCGLPGWGQGWAGTLDASGALSGSPLTNGCHFLSVSPDGRRALAGSVGVMPWVFGIGSPGHFLKTPDSSRNWHADHAVWMPSGREILAKLYVEHVARFDAETGAILAFWPHGGVILNRLSVSADGRRYLVTVNADGVDLGDPIDGNPRTRRSLRMGRKVAWAGFIPKTRNWICLTTDGEVTLRDQDEGAVAARRSLGAARSSVCLDATGRRIALWGPSGTVDILDTGSLESLCEPVRIPDRVREAVFLSGDELAVLSVSGEVCRWSIGGRGHPDVDLPAGEWRDGVWSPDGRRIALLSEEGDLFEWSVDSGAPPIRIGRHPLAETLRYADAGRRLVAYGQTMTRASCWDLSRPGSPPVWKAGGNWTAMTADAAGQRLLAATEDGRLRFWDVASDRDVFPPAAGVRLVNGLKIEPSERWAMVSEHAGRLRFFDLQTGRFDGEGWRLPNAVLEPSLTADNRLGLGHAAGELLLLDVATRSALPRRLQLPIGFQLPSVHPDGQVLLTASPDHQVRRIRIPDGVLISDPIQISGEVTALAWDRTGQRFLSASEMGVLQVHDGDSGNSLSGPIQLGSAPVSRASFSPDGRWILALDRSHRGRLVAVGPPAGGRIPPWLALAAEWASGERLGGGADGRLPQAIPPSERERIRLELEVAVRADGAGWESLWKSLRGSER